jgi:hypothetical protein
MLGLGWSWRSLVWIGLALVAGAPCAFLALETIGIPFAGLTLALLCMVGNRHGVLPETLLAFAVSYATVVVHFAVRDIVSAIQANDTGNTAYAVIHLAAAAILLVTGFALLARRRRATPDKAA